LVCRRNVAEAQTKQHMIKKTIKDILSYTYNEGDIYNTEAPLRRLQVAVQKHLLVADKLDSKGVAIRFKLTPLGYEVAEKLK